MKKIKTSLLILFAIIIVILIIFLVKNIINGNDNKNNEKIISEIKFMDTKLTLLLNSMNNISIDNNKLSVTKTSTSGDSGSNSSSSSNSSSQSQKEGESASNSSTQGGSKNESSNEQTSSNNTDNSSERYALKKDGILDANTEPNWEDIKNNVELLYSMVPTLTLDLYSLNLSEDEILGFNRELDELTILAKEENKEKTLTKLADLYRYLPVYASNSTDDLQLISLLDTKSNLFKAYVYADLGNWEEVKNYTQKAIDSYSAVLNNVDNNSSFNNSKVFVILNEIDSCVDKQDKEVFLIKYKAFLSESEKQ